MGRFIDYRDRERAERSIRNTWHEFRESLRKGEFKYDEVDKAKNTVFLKTYDDLFHKNSGMELKSILLKDLMSTGVGRGTVLDESETVNYDRFVPKEEYIKNDNRFSPPGVEWLYLAVGNSKEMYECAIAECRATKGDRFGFCNFEIDISFEDCKIVDLTIADNLTYDDINNAFDNNLEIHYKERKRAWKTGKFSKGILNKTEITKYFLEWSVYTHTKLLSEEIFVPVEVTEDKAITYAPFQAVAQYYISLGYSGLLFGSTVCPGGKNLVLFDKVMASPTGDITDEILG